MRLGLAPGATPLPRGTYGAPRRSPWWMSSTRRSYGPNVLPWRQAPGSPCGSAVSDTTSLAAEEMSKAQ